MTLALAAGALGAGFGGSVMADVQRLSTVALLRGAAERMREAGPLALVMAGVVASVFRVVQLGQDAVLAGEGDPGGLVTLALTAVATVIMAVMNALVLRVLLERRGGDLMRLDGPAVEGLMALTLASLSLALLQFGYSAVAQWLVARAPDPTDPDLPMRISYLAMGFTVAIGAALYVSTRLMLWPVARLVGRSDVGPRTSWRLTRRCVRAVVLANLAVLLPAFVLLAAVLFTGRAGVAPFTPASEPWMRAVLIGLWIVPSNAILATVYLARADNPAKLAEVFA